MRIRYRLSERPLGALPWPTCSLLKDGSAPDGHPDNLYQVITLTAQAYTESLLKDGNAPDGHFNRLYQVFTLMAQIYTESLLKNESLPYGFHNLYRVLNLTANSYNLNWTLALTTKGH